MIVAVVGPTGGVGKSTLCVNLAAEGVARGRSVLLVDADTRATTRTWGASAHAHDHPAPTLVAMDATMHRPGQLDRVARGHDLVLIDTPAHISAVLASALMAADLVVLACTPAGADTWALAEMAALVAKAQTVQPTLRTVLVINRVPGRTAHRPSVRQALAATGVPVLRTALSQRRVVHAALHAGLGITTYAPAHPAAGELRALYDELIARRPTARPGPTATPRHPRGTRVPPRRAPSAAAPTSQRHLLVQGTGMARARTRKRVAAYVPADLGTELAVHAARTGDTMSDIRVVPRGARCRVPTPGLARPGPCSAPGRGARARAAPGSPRRGAQRARRGARRFASCRHDANRARSRAVHPAPPPRARTARARASPRSARHHARA
jgi:chromosome partitioning protein